MSQNIPGANLPVYLNVSGLQVSWVSNTSLAVAAGQARDSNNVIDMPVTSPLSIDATKTGANGLDTGSLANSTWYYVYLIGSSLNKAPVAALLSASATPFLPTAYDSYRRIGVVLTNGSAQFLKLYQYGNNGMRKYFWDAVITVLSAAGNTAYTAISMTSAVAPTAALVYLNWKLAPNAAGDTALLRPTGSTATANQVVAGPVATQPNAGQLLMNCSTAQSIDYKTTSGSDALTLFVAGFEDFI